LWRCVMALGNTGWFPLLQDIVPSSETGSFFAKLRISWQSASLMVLLGVAFFLTDEDTPWWKFEVIFCGALGALFVRWLLFFGFKQRPPTESKDEKINLVRRFGEFVRHKRARNVGMYSAMYWCCAQLAIPFRIKYMKILGYNDGTILMVSAAISLGAIASLWLWGRLVDAFGNRAVFSITSIGMMITSILWVVVENSFFGLIMIFVLSFLFSAFSSGNNIALTRTMLHVVPKDRQYFMNFIRVLTNGMGALAPLVGGFVLYRIRGYSFSSGGIDFNSYHLFFIASGLVCVPLYWMRKRMRRGRELPTSQVFHIVTRPIVNTLGPVIHLGNRNDSEDK
jgi:predicted MFS family arabinose efflux permease